MKGRHILLFLLVFVVGVVAGRSMPRRGAQLPERVPTRATPPVTPVSVPAAAVGTVPEGLTSEETRMIEVFRRASDAVVSVRSLALRYDMFSLDVMQIPRGSGSGFVWDQDGHVVTNYHVIEGGEAFVVTLADQTAYEAKVVGVAPDKDLAVLRLVDTPREALTPLPLGRSASLVVGQKVLAVGNPFGLDQTLTVGVLSATGREMASPAGRRIHDVLQTDAAINPGNSGGPLLDSAGRLIGVNTSIVSPSGASAGIGFAIPVDTVRRLVPQLIEHGRPIQPGIGITEVPPQWLTRRIEGVAVREVVEGSPADRAGIEGIRRGRFRSGYYLGDVILAVDGEPVRDVNDLLDAFEAKGVGREVTLTLEREGKKREVKIELYRVR